jgi:hypothetical protein
MTGIINEADPKIDRSGNILTSAALRLQGNGRSGHRRHFFENYQLRRAGWQWAATNLSELAGRAKSSFPSCRLIQIFRFNDLDLCDGLNEHLGNLHSFVNGKGFIAQIDHDNLDFSSVSRINHTSKPVNTLQGHPAFVPNKPHKTIGYRNFYAGRYGQEFTLFQNNVRRCEKVETGIPSVPVPGQFGILLHSFDF